MTSVRKRKMNKSSVKKSTRRTKDRQRKININSNPIILANWDKKLTLSQNYQKMGLTAKLGKQTGGTEKSLDAVPLYEEQEPLDPEEEDPNKIPVGKANIIRDDNGDVIKIIYGLKEDKKESQTTEQPLVLQKLQELSEIKYQRQRVQSDRETEWLSKLYHKYGDDYEKMKWDKKLNVFQQSSGDLKKRINKWKKLNSII